MSIHTWLPGLEDEGGIQVYSRFIVRCLKESAIDAYCLLKNDNRSPRDYPSSTALGDWPNLLRTPLFAAEALFQGVLKRPELVLCCHANFSILGLWLKK